MPFERVLNSAELAPGASRKVLLGGQSILLSNLDGAFYAVHNTCLHRGGSLAEGPLENGAVVCPLHFWAFDLKSGACVQVPSMALKTFATKVENGEVYIDVE
jgi:nitrite reductase/ring-hydroxylating ferredoxin subunit